MRTNLRQLILCLLAASAFSDAVAQVESPILNFRRGMLWHSLQAGKVGPVFSNWGRRGIGLDWPGFDDTWIARDIGGPPSHLVTGGFYVGAKKDADSVFAVEDWAIYASSIANEASAKFIVTKHRHLYPGGANHYLKASGRRGEEVIETSWEYNLNYNRVDDRERQLPLRVTRLSHQWSGSKRDENYIIHEYTFKNISAEIRALDTARAVQDTLFDFYALAVYGMQVNSRAWTVLFPTLPSGARGTYHFGPLSTNPNHPTYNMMWARSGDYLDTPEDEEYMRSRTQGPIGANGDPTGEWLAPGHVGVKLLYASPNKLGQTSRVNKISWSGGSPSIDQGGPFTGKATFESRYDVLRDPANATNPIASSSDTLQMRRTRVWSLMSLGPWNLAPGDSIVIALAEIVDGVDYSVVVNPAASKASIGAGSTIFQTTARKAQFTYDQSRLGSQPGLNHPDPPAAPPFTLDYLRDRPGFAATSISWGTETESLADPDDGTFDLAGYRIYRSAYLPIGPWEPLGTVTRGDPQFYSGTTGRYAFVDSTGDVGTGYYYAVTAYDTGKASWPINPAAVFPETGNNRVPPLESSIFANRTTAPFKMTLPSSASLDRILVVPNPYVIGEGFSQPTQGDEIQFVNIPNPATIRIYTVRGDLVKTLPVPVGFGGIVAWDQLTDFGQFVESGIYIYHVESPLGTKIGKLAIVR